MGAMSKVRGSTKNQSYPQTEGMLADTVQKFGRGLGHQSDFGKALCDAADAFRQMADVKYQLEDNVKHNFLDPISDFQNNELKDFNAHRNKLKSRRLDYDAKKRKQTKEDELVQAEEKLEESKQLTEKAMYNILNNDVEQITQLKALVEAQLDFHQQTLQILENLKSQLGSRVFDLVLISRSCIFVLEHCLRFVFFWGLVFLVTTTLVFIFKHEIDHSIPQRQEKVENGHHHPVDEDHSDELSLNVFETYTVLVKILCLKPMLIMVVVLLTGKIGGTYMTLLNTLNNLGGNWPVTLFLSITDFFNRKNCVAKSSKIVLGVCTRKHEEELCKAGGDVCEFVVDGYYISVAICVVVGLLWYRIFYRRIKYFQKIPRQEWRRFLIRSAASRSFNAVRTMRVVPIPALHDNYMYLIVDDQQPKGERLAAIVDPVDVDKIFKTVKEEGALLQAALVTHHHSDHAGGTAELAKVAAASSSACAGLVKAPLCIYSGDAARVHCTDKVLGDGQTAALGPLLHIQAMYTPCHTSTHVCYYVVDQRTNERAVFTGDTLFVGGCGRFFEGTAEQMHCALNERLAALPDETMVFCGHEYTVANLQFALTVEPSNDTIRRKLDWAMAQRCGQQMDSAIHNWRGEAA
uniref:hydroxyacylglutathione hydrolase n=1 Tax=Globodera pallida TaxID=36090 RepID=A0A183BUZ3_GLOPA